MNEETEVEVEEDNIDPLVAPPLLAQPTPSLYYPPSLRLRFPTYRTPTTSRNSRNYPGHARALSCAPEEGFSKKRGKSMKATLTFTVVFLGRSSSLTFLRHPCFAPVSSHIGGRGTENDSRRSVAVATEDSWQVSRKSCKDQRACESATSLKINSVKEPTDIRGLREDFMPQTYFLILSRSISLCLVRCSFRLSIIRRAFLVCLVNVTSMFPIFLFYFHCTVN